MLRAFVAVSVSLSSLALAQADGGAVPASAETDVDSLKRDLDSAKKEMKDMREEMRAQLANQSVAQGWQEDWVPEKRKLETFVPDGYFRIRPSLLYHMDLGRGSDPSGYELFPRSPASQKDRTEAGVDMRFRFEPTFNISEEVRIRAQIDMLDNVLFGSTPDNAFSRDPNHAYDLNQYSIFSMSQTTPTAGVNSLADSIKVKRVWGEVSTPVGILRFGRMGSHWGLGMLHNDGNCLDCDLGDTVDRIQFVAEPISGWYIAPAIDFNVEGPYSSINGQPFDLSNSDDAHSLVLAAARRDTESQAKAKIDSGGTVINFGVHFTYRWQKDDAQDYYSMPFTTDGTGLLPRGAVGPSNAYGGYVQRQAKLFMPDVWGKIERKEFRVEVEAAMIGGDIFNAATSGAQGNTTTPTSLGILQFAAVLQAEVRLLDQALKIGLEVGFASGDPAPGFGYYPNRKVSGVGQVTQPGDIDGPQYNCPPVGGCSGAQFDQQISNFRMNPSFRPDMILFREIIGGVTDAVYFKPNASYRVADGFNIFAAVIYSRAIYASSTPSSVSPTTGDANLGIEINAGARYETEDGFFGQLEWGILFPLDGLKNNRPGAISFTGVPVDLESAQALRGSIGIRF